MWIIPSNHPLYSAYAQECVAPKEDLNGLSGLSISLPSWRWKPSLLQTFSRVWNRVYFIPHLFGRMLKPSMHSRFIKRYTASLVDIHANHSPRMESEEDKTTHDTFTLLYQKLFRSSNQRGVSLKTSKAILHADSILFARIYKAWVTQLKQ